MLQTNLFDLVQPTVEETPETADDGEGCNQSPHEPDSRYPAATDWLERKIEAEMRERIQSKEDAETFLVELGDGCWKAQIIREKLADPYWNSTPENMAFIIAFQRNVMCRCHKYGTFERV